MARSKLPKELERCINEMANARAQGGGSLTIYRRTYKAEKARLLAQVVTWLEMGKTVEEILVLLQAAQRRSLAELRKTIRELTQVILETP